MSFFDSLKSGASKLLDAGASGVKTFLPVVGDIGGDFVKGLTSQYFGQEAQRDSSALQYAYAERYAKNSPSWAVEGLRRAGLNPILAAGNGVSMSSWSPSSSANYDTNGKVDISKLLLSKQMKLLDSKIEGQLIKNNNDRKNMGLSGHDAAAARLFNELRSVLTSPKDGGNKINNVLKSFLSGRPMINISKRADYNEESFTEEERQAERFYDLLISLGYSDADARYEMGDDMYEQYESYLDKHRRNVRGTKDAKSRRFKSR